MDFETKITSAIGILVAPIILIAVFLLLLVPTLPFVSFQSPGNGEHTGYVTATEYGGFPWKTYRAYIKTDAESTQEDAYCVQNQEVYAQLLSAQKTRQLVTIQHVSELVVPNWKCGGESAIITAVN